jgi:RNA polymerase sigma-70 factor (ECF subfamily)
VTTLAETFAAASGRAASDPVALEAILVQAVRDASEAWPDVKLLPETFIFYLAGRVADGETLEVGLRKLCLVDLYLACACARGDARAIAEFDARYFTELERALRKMRLDGDSFEEIKQQLRVQLFVSDGDDLPDIAHYAGRGDLRLWVRTAGVRAALKLLRRGKYQIPDGGQALLMTVSDDDDPELARLRETCSADLKAAMGEAAAALTVRQRNLLRHHIVDGLTIDEVGRIYAVHRATAARWIADARAQLLTRTQQLLRTRLRIGDTEVDSIVRLVRSQLDLSVHRLLGGRKRKGAR